MRKFDFYFKDIKIGEYQEYGKYEMRIILNDNCNLNEFKFFGLKALQSNKIIDTNGVTFFFRSRVTPETQDGIDRKLKLWGLKYYDMMNILYRSDCINIDDHFWINFSGHSNYDKNHPRGAHFEKILGMPLEKIKQ